MTREDPPELLLRRSDTGHHVLVEPVSQTVVVDESWERAHARMLELLAAKPAPARGPARPTFEFRGRMAWWALAAAIVAPLVWLLAIERRVSAIEAAAAAEAPPPRAAVNSGASPPEEALPRLRGKPIRGGRRVGEGRRIGAPRPLATHEEDGRASPPTSGGVTDAPVDATADEDDL